MHQPRRRAAVPGPGDLLHRRPYRPRADPRPGRGRRRHLGRLYQCRHGTWRVRHGRARRLHARPRRGGPDPFRPPHAGGDRRSAGERHGRGERPLQCLAVPPDPRPRGARHPALPGGRRRSGARVRRSLPVSAPGRRRRSHPALPARADGRRPRAGACRGTARPSAPAGAGRKVPPRRSGVFRPRSTCAAPIPGRSIPRASCCSA